MELLLAGLLLLAAGQPQAERHRRWIEEEVPYLVTERESQIFRSLGSDLERDRFVEAFWRKRDPVRGTPENEFRDEHYRRLAYANERLRGEAFVPGWRTDRGRMRILLGAPRSVERFEFVNNLHDTELWFYQGDRTRDLPSFFYLIFFRRQEAADYRLFVPGADVPGDLLRGPARSFPERDMEQLLQVSPELARAALAMDAAEPVDLLGGQAGLGSQAVLARIESSPRRAVRNDDLDAWERWRDRVSAEYSFGFVPSESAFAVLYGPDGTPFLHFTVEMGLDDLALEGDDPSFTTLDATLEIATADGDPVLIDERETFLQLEAAQLRQVAGSGFAYQDGTPLAPGDYEVLVILRNRVSSEYTVAEARVRVEPDPGISDLILGFRTESAAGGAFRTFEAGTVRIHPAPGATFAVGDEIHVAFQARAPASEVRLALLQEGEVVAERSRPVREPEPPLVSEVFPLGETPPGRYALRVRLVDSAGAVVAAAEAPLSVSPRRSVRRAGVFARRSFDADRAALVATALGDQHWAAGRFEEAEAAFRRAVAEADPDAPDAQWKLAAAHLRAGRAEAALALLLPLQYAHGDRYEVVVGLGLGFYLKENFRAAAPHLENAVTLAPPRPPVLNALGISWSRLGEPEKAVTAFRRSLGLDPDQPEIADRLAALESGP